MAAVEFYQLIDSETSTYTYLLADGASREAVLIDPVLGKVDRDLKLVEELGLKLCWVLDTHVHADHITGAGEIRKRTGCKTGLSEASGVGCADRALRDGDELKLGSQSLRVLATPGHTNSCLSFYFDGMIFTGDALTIRGAGRTDFQQGSAEKLYESIQGRLYALPDETKVYPGHDYRGHTVSTIGLEKRFNARISAQHSKAEFVKIMSELNLPEPKNIAEAVPANLACGLKGQMKTEIIDGIPEVSPATVAEILATASIQVRLIDVRRRDEFTGELGHIAGAKLFTLGPELTTWLASGDRNLQIVFICRSGARSGGATKEASALGYKSVANMTGGMMRWNAEKLPVERT